MRVYKYICPLTYFSKYVEVMLYHVFMQITVYIQLTINVLSKMY